MLVSPNQDSSAGLTAPELQCHPAGATHGASSRAEQVARRMGFITEALAALESELGGDAGPLDRFEEMYDQLQHNLETVQGNAANGSEDSLISVHDNLDDLLQRFEHDIPANVPRATGDSTTSEMNERSHDMLLDDVLADVEPLTDRADAAIEKHSELTAHMTLQLARLVAVSKSLTDRAACLSAQAQDLNSQQDRLQQAREELSLERERLSHERFELSLRREAIDAETVDLQRVYGSLSEQLSSLQASGHSVDEYSQDLSFDSAASTPGISGSDGSFSDMEGFGDDSESTIERPFPPQLVSEYVWSGEKTKSDEPAPCQSVAGSVDKACTQQREVEHLQAERQKLREFVEAFDAADAAQDAESVPVEVGSALMLGENNTQNARRSRDEAIRQLDELLSSYASVDTSRSTSASMSVSVTQTPSNPITGSTSVPESAVPAEEATFDFDSGDSLFGKTEELFDCDLTADEPTAIIPRLNGGASDSDLEYDERVNYEADEDPTADAIETLPEFPCVEVVPVPPMDEASACGAMSEAIEHVSLADVSVERSIEDISTLFAVSDQPEEEFEEQIESSSSAGSLFQKVEAAAAPVMDEPAKSETSSATAAPTGETDKVANLRSQLAEMFGIDSLKDETSSAAPTSHSGSSGSLFSNHHTADEEDSAANDQQSPSSSAELATGSLLREVLKSETPATAPVAPVSEPARTEEPAASGDDDPIKAYMAQLLARNRQQSGKTDPVAVQAPPFGRTPSATAAAATSVKSDASVDDASVDGASETPKTSVNDLSWLSESPKHKQDKDSVRAHMKTLREVANQSARTAVVRSNKRQLKMQVLTKTAAAVMSLIFGATSLILELPVIYGYSVICLGLIFAVDLLIVIARSSMKKAKAGKKHAQSDEDRPVEVKADPRTEGRLANFTRAEQSK